MKLQEQGKTEQARKDLGTYMIQFLLYLSVLVQQLGLGYLALKFIWHIAMCKYSSCL